MRTLGLLGWVMLFALVLTVPADAGTARKQPAGQPIAALGYYYIWFNPSSWRRAKRDLPLLGPYSSDERRVMLQHVRWAKQAGLTGFIVSWKSTPTLDRRLGKLVAIADAQRFKLAIIYEGLDFERRPLSPGRIEADLDLFATRYRHDPAFRIFGKPLVVWSGTWRFSRAQVASVTRRLRDRLLIVASEKDVQGYERIADLVDGDAYYWSSIDPATYPGYPGKLVTMGRAVHARRGLWIAPAAPGFDARLIGGHRVVERRQGDTLRRELDGALASSPDAIGVISWNEFSENTQVEPSRNFGFQYLHVLADALGAPSPSFADFESDQPGSAGIGAGRLVVIGLAIALAIALPITISRQRRSASRSRRTEGRGNRATLS